METKTIEMISEVVCNEFGVPLEQAKRRGRGGKRPLVRQVVMYYAVHNGYGFKEASAFFNLDWSSARYAYRVVNDFKKYDNHFYNSLKKIDGVLYGINMADRVADITQLLDLALAKVEKLKEELETIKNK